MKFLWSSFSRDLQRAVWAGSALAALLLFGANCFGQAQELAFTNRGGINKVWRTIEGSIYLRNWGHRPATNIRIEVEGPPGWIAKVQPEFIDSVPPYGGAELMFSIKPPWALLEQHAEFTVRAKTESGTAERCMRVSAIPPFGRWLRSAAMLLVAAAIAIFVIFYSPHK